MNNYYEFYYTDDKESFEYFNSLSTNILKNILNAEDIKKANISFIEN